MRKNGFYGFMAYMIFISLLNGCVSVSGSSSPNPRLYTLYSPVKEKVIREFVVPDNTIVGIGPVKIPEYLNRPQIVTMNKDKTIVFDEFNRWGEPLDFALERATNENLSLLLKGASLQMFPWDVAITAKYQVIIDVVRMESNLNEDLFLAAQWSIINLEKKQAAVTKRSEFTQRLSAHNYYGLTKALSEAVASLSAEIAQELASLTKPPQVN